jgi:hypothetical protein
VVEIDMKRYNKKQVRFTFFVAILVGIAFGIDLVGGLENISVDLTDSSAQMAGQIDSYTPPPSQPTPSPTPEPTPTYVPPKIIFEGQVNYVTPSPTVTPTPASVTPTPDPVPVYVAPTPVVPSPSYIPPGPAPSPAITPAPVPTAIPAPVPVPALSPTPVIVPIIPTESTSQPPTDFAQVPEVADIPVVTQAVVKEEEYPPLHNATIVTIVVGAVIAAYTFFTLLKSLTRRSLFRANVARGNIANTRKELTLKACPSCGKQVPYTAVYCPFCTEKF